MKVGNFDSNGLIFGLNQGNFQVDEAVFKASVLRIMDAQGFLVFPLVDKPRVRTNLNNMTSRPKYEKGGSVTHVCVKRGTDLEIHEISAIDEWSADDSILDRLEQLFHRLANDPETPPVAMVNGRHQKHEAVWSLSELNSTRFRNWLLESLPQTNNSADFEHFSTVLWSIFDTSNTLVSLLESTETEAISSKLKSCYELLHQGIQDLQKANLSEAIGGRRVLESGGVEGSELMLSHVMRFGAAGVIYDDSSLNSREESRLAARMLARANDFDYLVAYPLRENSGLLHVRLHEIIMEKGVGRWYAFSTSLHDVIPTMFDGPKPVPVFIRPHPLFVTGEGSLRWPSVLSTEELNNIHGCAWFLSLITKWEHWGKSKLTDSEYYIDGKKRSRTKLTLGQIRRLLNERGVKNLPSKALVKWRNSFVHNFAQSDFTLPSYESVKAFLAVLKRCEIVVSEQQEHQRLAKSISKKDLKSMSFRTNAERLAVVHNLESLFEEDELVRMSDFDSQLARSWFSPQSTSVSRLAFKRHLELGLDINTPDHVFFGKIRPSES